MAPIVDSHLHIWSEDRDRYPRADTPYRASPELLLDYMDESGVDHVAPRSRARPGRERRRGTPPLSLHPSPTCGAVAPGQ